MDDPFIQGRLQATAFIDSRSEGLDSRRRGQPWDIGACDRGQSIIELQEGSSGRKIELGGREAKQRLAPVGNTERRRRRPVGLLEIKFDRPRLSFRGPVEE